LPISVLYFFQTQAFLPTGVYEEPSSNSNEYGFASDTFKNPFKPSLSIAVNEEI